MEVEVVYSTKEKAKRIFQVKRISNFHPRFRFGIACARPRVTAVLLYLTLINQFAGRPSFVNCLDFTLVTFPNLLDCTGAQLKTEAVVPWSMRIIMAVCAIFTFFVLFKYFDTFGAEMPDKREAWGQFGDFIGGSLNPIFAMFAFFALLYTIALQRSELEATRDALERSAMASEQQVFESTYFQLLKMYADLVNSLDIVIPTQMDDEPKSVDSCYRGRRAIEKVQKVFVTRYLQRVARGDYVEEDGKARIDEYKKFEKEFEFALGHYFRTIYNIVRFVDRRKDTGDLNQNMPKEKRHFYIKLLRAQLSRSELALLFYNAKFGPGQEHFLPMVEEYNLLKYLDANALKEGDYETFKLPSHKK